MTIFVLASIEGGQFTMNLHCKLYPTTNFYKPLGHDDLLRCASKIPDGFRSFEADTI